LLPPIREHFFQSARRLLAALSDENAKSSDDLVVEELSGGHFATTFTTL
jgi:hypothetical protein